MPGDSQIPEIISKFVLEKFLPGEGPEALNDKTPLISGGIMNSIDTIKLVAFLEGTFQIQFKSFEIGVDYLNDIASIAEMVRRKINEKG
jgi:acyl carrier protein